MTALDRQFVQLRFAALLIPLGLLLWLHSASVPVAILLGGMLAAYNGVAALAIRRNAVSRFGKPMAVLLLVLDHLVVTGWILLFASPLQPPVSSLCPGRGRSGVPLRTLGRHRDQPLLHERHHPLPDQRP